MVETTSVLTSSSETVDHQTQFGNNRILEQSDCLFVFKTTESDYDEPPSDNEEVDLKPLRESIIAIPSPKISEKRKAEDAEASKDLKKAKLETKALKAKRPGFTDERYNETSYYVENGLRKVYPYYFTFTTFTKGRWVGEKILEVFAREFRAHPAEEYERCIRAGTLTVNYQTVDVDYRLRHNDLLANIVHRHEVPVTSEPITVIHMDEDVVVVNKPASIPVHPCGRYRHNTVVFILAKEYNLKNLRTIHRLDRLTSGILLFGRTPKKARQMEHQIRNRQVHKQYVCRVEGEFPDEEIICSESIEVVSYKIGVCKVSEKGKDCLTRFKRLSYNGKSSVVLCKPQTGRMHQIRVHLQYLGYPVINDPLYNHTVFGPEKGKGGNIGKTDEELVKDLIGIHNAENWLGMDGDSEMSLFKPKLDIEDRESNASTDKDGGSPSSTPGIIEDEQIQQQQQQQHESLSTLHLFQNQLNGSILQALCQLTSLSGLALNENNLYGSIPTCFGQLSNLSYLTLNDNNISGSIPPELGKLYNLYALDIGNNYLSGTIPDTLVNLKNLVLLSLYQNQLNGSIPSEIGKLTSLTEVALQLNHLSGPIPSSLGELKSLYLLRLHYNMFSGPIPQELGNMTSLTNMQLGTNQLNGSIPSSFGNLENLEILSLCDNQLASPIPRQLGNLKLVEIDITNNSFSGSLPYDICNGRKLEYLGVSNNKLTGLIPTSLYNCSSLTRVRFDGNQITGDISERFGVYPHLYYINLNDNQLYGELSDNWSKCGNVSTIQMGGNRMQGNIPTSLANLIRLETLNLSFNGLVGEIPKEFGRMARMGELFLNNNQLSGIVPPDLGSLDKLMNLDLSMNKLNGSVPISLGQCLQLVFLNLSNNVITGAIPVQLGRLTQMSVLDLSNNLLIKEIPSGLSSMSTLETLNLSHNKLSGNIPKSFESMKALLNIDLSYNHLQGPLPKSKAFMNLTIEALQGNDDLCGNVTGLKQCASESRTPNHKHYLALVISLPLIGALILGFLMASFTFNCWRSKRLPSSHHVDEHKHGQNFFSVSNFNGRETYEEILNRTEEFNKAYCIGMGGCGSVYKVKLSSGDIVAVKRLHSSSEVINHNDFINEIKALTRIRHRNIIKLLGYCSHAQNSFLVYEYLEGGCLADILGNTAQTLDWTKRINIIKGVAYALSYMHHDCYPAIIHRDISSKNILLDSEYEACVSDFGTSKILNPNSSNWSNIAGTLGYLAPELAYNTKITEKCDVYSFGVLVLEIIKGTHPGDIITSLISTATERINLTYLVDHRLPTPLLDIKEVLTSILILAIKCVNSNPEIRPTMHEVSAKVSCIICNMYKGDGVV